MNESSKGIYTLSAPEGLLLLGCELAAPVVMKRFILNSVMETAVKLFNNQLKRYLYLYDIKLDTLWTSLLTIGWMIQLQVPISSET